MTDTLRPKVTTLSLFLILMALSIQTALAQSTTFTYQGKLSENGNPAIGGYDFQFRCWLDRLPHQTTH